MGRRFRAGSRRASVAEELHFPLFGEELGRDVGGDHGLDCVRRGPEPVEVAEVEAVA